MTTRYRVGIDVGGTFTDVVAVDAQTRALVAMVKVPTTHDHPDGVAAGIVAGLEALLARHAIDPNAVAFIAHSTTQATNALLEGDLATVAVVRVARGPFAALVRAAMSFRPIATGPRARFEPVWLDDGADAAAVVARAQAGGIEAIAVSDAFAVDRPEREREIVAAARAAGVPATGGADVSAMYGLRARTRTAALNAAILPRMLRTARVTRRAVDDARIPAPLMVMRSDGGVMDVAEVERRPILTMLSGPAAGIAGALFHENVTDGIFIEVGGTSADCSVIVRGRPQVRPARIGGHRTLLRTLDVRTVGIAGGSLAEAEGGRVTGVGPRSAHIAGYAYAAFTPAETIAAAQPSLEGGILALVAADGTRIAITPTCAANALGIVPDGAFARGDAEAARAACAAVGTLLGSDGETVARAVLDGATAALQPAIDELVRDYALDRATVTVVGGGGGAGALVPYVAERLGLHWRIAHDAEVISPLGVALALVRDVVERTIVDPTPADLARIRREAVDAAIASGAAPERVEVVVDVDRARNRVRATASGATALVEGAAVAVRADDAARRNAAAAHLRLDPAALRIAARAGSFEAYAAGERIALVDDRGVVRLVLVRAVAAAGRADAAEALLRRIADERTTYGDVGRALPDVFVARGERVGEFAGFADLEAIVALAAGDLAGVDPAETVMILAASRAA